MAFTKIATRVAFLKKVTLALKKKNTLVLYKLPHYLKQHNHVLATAWLFSQYFDIGEGDTVGIDWICPLNYPVNAQGELGYIGMQFKPKEEHVYEYVQLFAPTDTDKTYSYIHVFDTEGVHVHRSCSVKDVIPTQVISEEPVTELTSKELIVYADILHDMIQYVTREGKDHDYRRNALMTGYGNVGGRDITVNVARALHMCGRFFVTHTPDGGVHVNMMSRHI